MRDITRKHPRVHDRKHAAAMSVEKERYLDLSITAAVGILAVAFVKGIFWGYMIRRSMD